MSKAAQGAFRYAVTDKEVSRNGNAVLKADQILSLVTMNERGVDYRCHRPYC